MAGMGADLFESFVGSIVATITLAQGDVVSRLFLFGFLVLALFLASLATGL